MVHHISTVQDLCHWGMFFFIINVFCVRVYVDIFYSFFHWFYWWSAGLQFSCSFNFYWRCPPVSPKSCAWKAINDIKGNWNTLTKNWLFFLVCLCPLLKFSFPFFSFLLCRTWLFCPNTLHPDELKSSVWVSQVHCIALNKSWQTFHNLFVRRSTKIKSIFISLYQVAIPITGIPLVRSVCVCCLIWHRDL